jgi:hypothetical protein
MSYTHKTDYKRKYRFDSFDFKVPEFIDLLTTKAETWVIDENASRIKSCQEMMDPKQNSKEDLKQNAKRIKEHPDWYGPVTINDFIHRATWECRYQVFINPVDGSFNITLKTEMGYMDKLNKGLKRKQEKGVK